MANNDDKITILLAQYEHAQEMYRHEDILVWKKVQALGLLIGATGAALAFAITHTHWVIFVMSIASVSAAICVLMMLVQRNSTRYIPVRRKNMEMLEAELAKLGGAVLRYAPDDRAVRHWFAPWPNRKTSELCYYAAYFLTLVMLVIFVAAPIAHSLGLSPRTCPPEMDEVNRSQVSDRQDIRPLDVFQAPAADGHGPRDPNCGQAV